MTDCWKGRRRVEAWNLRQLAKFSFKEFPIVYTLNIN
jgi:hypothetical protein